MLRYCLVLVLLGPWIVAWGQQAPALERANRVAAARRAGDYLVRILNEEGRFIYSYYPLEKQVHEGYNLLRHAGTIYALSQLYDATGEAAYLEAAVRAAVFLRGFVEEVQIDGRSFTALVSDPRFTKSNAQEGRVVKTGGCALALIAFLSVDRIQKRGDYLELCKQLGRYLERTQMANGNVLSKYLLERGEYSSWKSAYYPGETAVALAMLAAATNDARTRESMARLLLYLAMNWEIHLNYPEHSRDFDHWGLIGLATAWPLLTDEMLSTLSPSASVWTRQRLLEVARDYVQLEWLYMVRGDGIAAALDGAIHGTDATTTPVATRLEAIQLIHRLLRQQELAADSWPPLIERQLQFVLRGQYSAHDAKTIGGPLNIAGAFRRGVLAETSKSAEIRIDYSQHAISALLDP